MTEEEAAALLERVTYKPNRRIFLERTPEGVLRICILQGDVPDATGRESVLELLKWTGASLQGCIFAALEERDVLELAREEVLRLEEHEAHEWLRLDGKLLYDPHDESGKNKTQLALGGAMHIPWMHWNEREPA